jgi:2-iminobutanoate/2-iminopropanoate deaminase
MRNEPWITLSPDEGGEKNQTEEMTNMERMVVGRAPLGLPFSLGVLAGDTLYLSGAIGFDEKKNTVVAGGIEPETRKAMEQLERVLKEAGMDLTHVVKVTVYLADMDDFQAFNRVYGEYFSDNFPARETVAVKGLALDAKIEMSFVAVR